MKRLILVVLAVVTIAGCAESKPITMHNDWRSGTNQSPYRTVPTALICTSC
ncbi:hypothetical protein [Burkholderia savannae]|uniref:hypothetical protein n=1 Tax=Burkholderia savannae TaxID=1637837 RepID=UPI000AF62A1A|nr:hypothetical protein [Burkholderia savannae]